jgi:hypothetical protein
MAMENFVTVYRYTFWDEQAQERRSSDVFATLEQIRSGLGQPIHASAIKVPLADLGENGVYIATETHRASWP